MTSSQLEPARMVTPEAVALEFRTANLGSRILAYLIDMVVVVAGILAGLFAVALLGQASDVVVPDWVALTIVLVLLPAWWLGYFIAFETLWRGRTLGKAALVLGRQHHRGAHLAVLADPFQQPLEMLHGGRPHLQHRAVVAGELVDLHNLGVVAGLAGLEQAAVEAAAHLDERGQRQAGPRRVHAGLVADDHTEVLQPPHPLGHRRR